MLLVVSDELGGLGGNLLEDVVNERVHDGHGSLGDSDFGVDLLEHSVDVDGEGLNSLFLLLDDWLSGLGGVLSGSLGWH